MLSSRTQVVLQREQPVWGEVRHFQAGGRGWPCGQVEIPEGGQAGGGSRALLQASYPAPCQRDPQFLSFRLPSELVCPPIPVPTLAFSHWAPEVTEGRSLGASVFLSLKTDAEIPSLFFPGV